MTKSAWLAACVALFAVASLCLAQEDMRLVPPKNGPIKVAFVLSDGAVVIDFAGPWEVFAETHLPGEMKDMEARMPFELYTVAPSKTPINTSGSHHAGMKITPDYDFGDVPEPDIVVIGAQHGGPGLSDWLKKIHAHHKIIVSVCTGAFRVAETGLLNGKQASTHHDAADRLASTYPDIKVMRSVRYVQSDPTIFTSGGLTSGIDLALHIVEGYYGREVAQATADQMEYQGLGWKNK
jgi:transcriptional regulator GlxA family with amidase domain